MSDPIQRLAKNWIVVASADHACRGVAGGFIQVNHGKAPPLRRMLPGDRVAIYSPTQAFGVADGLQSFTALGTVLPSDPFVFDMGGGFEPWRRTVDWTPVRPAPIRPLLAQLDFTSGQSNWAAPLRFGLVQITAGDMERIAKSLTAG